MVLHTLGMYRMRKQMKCAARDFMMFLVMVFIAGVGLEPLAIAQIVEQLSSRRRSLFRAHMWPNHFIQRSRARPQRHLCSQHL
jgi:hypothetical protein